MRKEFVIQLYKQMVKDPKIVVLTGDLGYKMFDKIRFAFPDRFINVGASEFTMVGIAIGLALEGKTPICYTITPFYYRAFELLRTYVDHENIPIKLVGSGRDRDYQHDGYSHNAEDVNSVLNTLPNIEQMYPRSNDDIASLVEKLVNNGKASFLSLRR